MVNPVFDILGGTRKWLNEKGLPHRTDGPAIDHADGYKEWYLNGLLHRTDGPAIEHANGYNSWYQNGVRHRTDGPAVEGSDGYKAWYLNGVRHRTDGPAIERYKSWWLNGTQILSEDLFLKLTGPIKSLPLYLGLGFDQYISERIKNESNHKE